MPEKRNREAWVNLLFMLIPSGGIVLLTTGISLIASKFLPAFFPGPLPLSGIFMGVCLVGGALIVAYGERQLLSEHSRQYSASHGFFNSSRVRLEQHLEAMHAALVVLDNPQGSTAPELVKAECDFHAARERIHQLLFALGKEALDENSEWLVLHRARPMEPVMAG